MYAVTAAQMRDIDRRASEEYGIPSLILMENAGRQVADFIRSKTAGSRIVVVAGPGNNGGDGFVVARHLYQEKQLVVFITEHDHKYSNDALVNLNIVRKLDIPLCCLRDDDGLQQFKAALSSADMVVDAVFGTGLTRELTGYYDDLIRLINAGTGRVLSIDMPSGICSQSGKILGAAVEAHHTITFALPKLGHYLHPGAISRGDLHVVDIGIPVPLLEGFSQQVLTEDYIRTLLPTRPANSHKGTFGTVLLVAGSGNMSGAAVLSARAALRGGCGLLYVALPGSIQATVASQVPEAITVPLPESASGHLVRDAADILRDIWQSCSCVAMGPGLGQTDELFSLLTEIIHSCQKPLVLDADALNLLARNPGLTAMRTAPTVLTPHPGEAAHLLSKPAAAIIDDRIGSALQLSQDCHSVVALKGAYTIVANPSGKIAINTTGNSGMATAGSGDVLTGLVAALLAMGIPAEAAVPAAVYLHGKAGDLAALDLGPHSLLAGDIACYISKAYLHIQKINI